MKVFLSFHFDGEQPQFERFAYRVSYYLGKQADLEVFCYQAGRHTSRWREPVGANLAQSERLVLFVGRSLGEVQEDEMLAFLESHPHHERGAIWVRLPGSAAIPDRLFQGRCITIESEISQPDTQVIKERGAEECARRIVGILGNAAWIADDGLPVGSPFDYEKDIISEFVAGGGRLQTPRRLSEGCPQTWPDVQRVPPPASPEMAYRQPHGFYDNPIGPEAIGGHRRDGDRIVVDTRAKYHSGVEGASGTPIGECGAGGVCLTHLGLSFPEAGPRPLLLYPVNQPTNRLRVAVLISGGIAPGINAVLAGIAQRHELYAEAYAAKFPHRYELEVRGYLDGFAGLRVGSYKRVTAEEARKWADAGGSEVGTSRYEPLLDTGDPSKRKARSQVIDRYVTLLDDAEIDILYVIGGDGSMKAAHAIWTRAQSMWLSGDIHRRISVVAIPKTMDNDILWVWQAFGFLSAVEKAREFVRQLHTEAKSNPRLGVVQLFGSDSGFVVSHTALASGVCNLALIPESPFSMASVSSYVCDSLRGTQRPYGVVLLSETAIPQDVDNYIEDKEVALEREEKLAVTAFMKNGRRVHGQTPDELRRAGLKIVSRVLQREIRSLAAVDGNDYWRNFRVFTNEPRHLIRAINPSVQDVIFGQRLGTLAVDNAMAGYTDFMISQWLTEFVLVPLQLVVLGRKRVPQGGIFWNSVLANTGQPANLA
jgi:6-phosphofructokinase 1